MRLIPIAEALGEDPVAAAANRSRVAEARMTATKHRGRSSTPGHASNAGRSAAMDAGTRALLNLSTRGMGNP